MPNAGSAAINTSHSSLDRPSKRRWHRSAASLLLLCCIWQSLWAADDDVGLWATGDYHYEIQDNWLASLAIQARFADDIERLERLLFRPSITYRTASGIGLTAGYDAHSVESPRDSIEHRSWQQIAIKQNFGRIVPFAHVRLEQRYFENVDDISLRLRLNAGVNIPLRGGFSASLANEIFFTLNDTSGGPVEGFDQNRLFAGFSKNLNERLNVRLGYQMQYVERAARDDLAGHQVFIFFTYK